MTDFSSAMHDLTTSTGVTAEEAERIKSGVLALVAPVITIEPSDGSDVDITSAERWENPDGTTFALVTLEEWPCDGSGWEPTS